MLFSKKLFLERYKDLHDRIVPTAINSLSEEHIRRMGKNQNSIIWIYWHILRTEDVGINRFILEKKQIYPDYEEKIKIKTSFNGTGMTLSEVRSITDHISLEGLKDYQNALMLNTIKTVESIKDDELNKTITKNLAHRIICQENTMPENVWKLLDLYIGKSKEWFLLHVSLTHPFYHLGQISTLAKSYNNF